MMEEVKIIYCFDESKTAVHYSKTIKGNKYFCIDCGSELICKDGKKKIKHLAHKNTEHCGGTGESIFHKHWKENLFKAGMFINIANRISEPENVEILEVLNEVSLNKRYNKNWENEIIVDVLLITEKGEIVVEINYKNSKNWDKLKPFYDELNLIRVYEVTVDKNINTTLKWFCLGEEEEIIIQIEEQKKAAISERLEAENKREQKKLDKEKRKIEIQEAETNFIKNKLETGELKEYKIFFNFKNSLHKLDNYYLKCVYEKKPNQFESIHLKFNHTKVTSKKLKELRANFKATSGIKSCYIIGTNNDDIENEFVDVLKYTKAIKSEYNNRLYAQLCNI